MMIAAALQLPEDLDPERMVLRKHGKQQPLRDSLTLSSYGIIDGTALDLWVTGVEPGKEGEREVGKGRERD